MFDLFTASIDCQVEHIKNLREWRTYCMTIEQEIKERAEYAAEKVCAVTGLSVVDVFFIFCYYLPDICIFSPFLLFLFMY